MEGMNDHDWLQIEQAANGCISGDLSEWPHLALAFKKLGIKPHQLPGVSLIPPASELRPFCQGIIAYRNYFEGNDSPTTSPPYASSSEPPEADE